MSSQPLFLPKTCRSLVLICLLGNPMEFERRQLPEILWISFSMYLRKLFPLIEDYGLDE